MQFWVTVAIAKIPVDAMELIESGISLRSATNLKRGDSVMIRPRGSTAVAGGSSLLLRDVLV
jgi:hypothetical protein